MTFDVFNDPLQGAGFVIILIFGPISILATILRFVCSRISLRKHGKDDWMALAAEVFYLGWITGCMLGVAKLNGTHDILTMPPEKTIEVLKIIWVSSLMFPPNQLFAKLSILFLYHRIFSINKKFAAWMKVLGALQILVSVISEFLNIFLCSPVEKAWNPMITGGSCIHLGAMLSGTETCNSLLDFALAIFAVFALRTVKIQHSTKWKLSIVFLLAGAAGVIGFVKIGIAYQDLTVYNQLAMGLLATVQGAFSVICCCAIMYKPILSKLEPIGHFTSKLIDYGSKIRLIGRNSSEKHRGSSDGGSGDIEFGGAR
ncbi:hypothetical protein PG985_011087 [Apiospora marii]|uniref:Rhodopsin domain-containing protein n=1 Tax=Apiospora marii TaxID=335849 RepID=A0ABR1SSP3_9PEZI